jgi:hypothetical protein
MQVLVSIRKKSTGRYNENVSRFYQDEWSSLYYSMRLYDMRKEQKLVSHKWKEGGRGKF